MKKLIIFFILLCAYAFSYDIIKRENGKDNFIEKIKFDGHTYIHYHNCWNSAGDGFVHDPGCECLKFDCETYKKILESKKKEEVRK